MRRDLSSFGAADWLSLSAAPVFALMALITALPGQSHAAAICSHFDQPTWAGGMLPMYLLMAAFHVAPWLRLTGTPR